MASFDVKTYSQTLAGEIEYHVFLPDEIMLTGRTAPVVWLFHGAFSDYASVLRETAIERYAAERNLALVVPTCFLGQYTDRKYGEPMWTFIRDEMIPLVRGLFCSLSAQPSENYLMGISMGGYGAFKLAANCPELFAAAAGFSSPIDICLMMHLIETGRHRTKTTDLIDTFGSRAEQTQTENDVLYQLGARKREGRRIPRLFLFCGLSDHALEEDRAAVNELLQMKIPIRFVTAAGTHDYRSWEPHFESCLDFLIGGGGKDGSD